MNCPKCHQPKLRITHSYTTPTGKTQRVQCLACKAIMTTQLVLVAVDPKYGQGAAAIARRMKKAAEAASEKEI